MFYSSLIQPDNYGYCSTNMARDVRTELEKCHWWFVCVIQLNHALIIIWLNYEEKKKENIQTVHILFVCPRHRRKI